MQDVCAIGGARKIEVSVLVECSVVARVNHDLSQAPAAAKASCLPHLLLLLLLLSRSPDPLGSSFSFSFGSEYLSRLTLTLRT